jgi:putative NIF3 family GTP cyclohydrolase 1 type 2
VPVIKHTNLVKNQVKKIAWCGGAGGFLLPAAIKNQADVFVSADFKYHDYFDADNKIIIADVGHYESEQYTKELLSEMLNEEFDQFNINISEVNTNPIRYS